MVAALQALGFLLFALLAGVCIGAIVMVYTLRRRFPDLWREWGAPDAWLSLQPTSPSRPQILAFLDSRAYEQTNDPGFIRFCNAVRLGFYAFFITFLVTFAAVGAAALFKE